MNNEIKKEVFYRKQMEVEGKTDELERLLIQYQDVKAATDEDVVDKLKNLKKLLEQGLVHENGEFAEDDIDIYEVRVSEDHFEWIVENRSGRGTRYHKLTRFLQKHHGYAR